MCDPQQVLRIRQLRGPPSVLLLPFEQAPAQKIYPPSRFLLRLYSVQVYVLGPGANEKDKIPKLQEHLSGGGRRHRTNQDRLRGSKGLKRRVGQETGWSNPEGWPAADVNLRLG